MQLTKTSIWHRIKARLLLILPISRYGHLTNFRYLDGKVRKILCISAAGIGDTIMVAPTIGALKARFPDASLAVLGHYNRDVDKICQLMPAADETIDIGLENYKWASVIKFMLGRFWKLVFELRRKKFGLAIVFMPNPVRRLMLAGLGCKWWIYGNRIDDYPGTIARQLLRSVGVEKLPQQDVFEVPEPANVGEILPGDLKKPLVCVHPFCGLEWKEWKKFGQLQEQLLKLGGTVVTVGQKQGYQTSSAVHNLVNKTSIAQLFWVIKQCDVFVTADSGPMHIGFVVGTPTVALFGFVAPDLLVPLWGQERRTIIYKPSDESKKIKRVTERNKLDDSNMQAISIDEVVQATKELLDRFCKY